MTMVSQDLRYAFRRLRKSPVFTTVCIITLALGIGANSAIFSLVNAVMLRSLPVAKAQELYRLGHNNNCCVIGGFQGDWGIYSYALYKQFRDHTPEFSELTAFQAGLMDLSARRTGATTPADAYVGEFVSGNYFSTFGIGAFAGRLLSSQDDQPNAIPIAMMSYRTWQEHFGLDPSVVGATFTINRVLYTIVGITSPGFFGDTLRPDPPDFWLPLASEPTLQRQSSLLNHIDEHWLYIIGRVRPGANIASVQTEVNGELLQWLSAQPDLTEHQRGTLGKQHIVLAPAAGGIRNLQTSYEAGLRLLTTIAGLLLLIACANLANLLLVRGAANRSETAVRVALGAPRLRLIREKLTESVLLAVFGGAAGLFVAFAGTRTILLLAFRGSHFVPISAAPSLPVLGFTFLLSLATGIVFGVAPAWIASNCDPAEALRGAGRGTQKRVGMVQMGLVVSQVAISAVLLIGAGLLTRSLRNLVNQNLGFEANGRLVLRVDPSLAGYAPEKLYGLYQQLQTRLPQVPGVLSASFSLYSPMRDDNWESGLWIEGHSPDEHAAASWNRVSSHYFETMGSHVLRGRAIEDQDTPNSVRIAVVSQGFARKYFPKQDPVGQHFGFGDASHAGDYEIVGIVEDSKYTNYESLGDPRVFIPLLQTQKFKDATDESVELRSTYIGDIELHVAGNTGNLEAEAHRALADVDPNLTILDTRTLTEQVALNFNQDRLIARLAELFGLLALVLACVGLYGITAYAVARRTREIGIRMALGASQSNVGGLVLGSVIAQLALGLAIGIPLALAGGRFLANQLFGVKPYDPLILAAAAAVLVASALVAGLVPAYRATRIDPIRALRSE